MLAAAICVKLAVLRAGGGVVMCARAAGNLAERERALVAQTEQLQLVSQHQFEMQAQLAAVQKALQEQQARVALHEHAHAPAPAHAPVHAHATHVHMHTHTNTNTSAHTHTAYAHVAPLPRCFPSCSLALSDQPLPRSSLFHSFLLATCTIAPRLHSFLPPVCAVSRGLFLPRA